MKTLLIGALITFLAGGCGGPELDKRSREINEAKARLSDKSLERAEKVIDLYCGVDHSRAATTPTLEGATRESIYDERSCRLAVYSMIDSHLFVTRRKDAERFDYAPLAHFTNLRIIDLEGTGLSSLDPLLEPLRSLPNLSILELKNNRLTSLRGLAEAVPKLEELNLSGNRFASLDAGHPLVSKIDLGGNPLQTLVGLGAFPRVVRVELGGFEFRADFDWEGLKRLSGVVRPTLWIERSARIAGLSPEESWRQLVEHSRKLNALNGPRLSDPVGFLEMSRLKP